MYSSRLILFCICLLLSSLSFCSGLVCNSCSYNTPADKCNNLYVPPVSKLTCGKIYDSDGKALCKKYSGKGYKVICTNGPSFEMTCTNSCGYNGASHQYVPNKLTLCIMLLISSAFVNRCVD
ncbi:hypothetical protein SNE40_020652 [Patella caerulea]|uniref:Uncharacterized protein n=1 Tax=Patella caerulea TaxID=87958 RepID=A0AAN8P7L9_PATCE